MKKTLKILVFCLLAVVLCFSAFACAKTDDTEKKGLVLTKSSGSETYKVYKFVDDDASVENGVLDIGKIAAAQEKTVGSIKKNAFNGNSTIKKLIVPTTVTEIEAGAFAGMKALEEIVLPFVGANAKGDPSFNATGSEENKAVDAMRCFGYVFGTTVYDEGKTETQSYNETSTSTYYFPMTLNKITITPAENYSIPMFAFNGITDVATVVLSDKVVAIGDHAFSDSGVSSVVIPDSVKTIGVSAFSNCGNLKAVSFGENSALVEIKEKAFSATKIEEIVLPESVKTIGAYAFASVFGSDSEEKLVVTSASALKKITLSKDLTEIGEGAFCFCEQLSEVNMGSVAAAKVKLGNYGFAYCKALTKATIEGHFEYNTAGNCFKNCK